MPENRIAVAHPGKIGDLLYSLPTVEYLSNKLGFKADFWTSPYCQPVLELLRMQPYIDSSYVNNSYKLDNFGCGAQPWQLDIPGDYVMRWQLGFRTYPTERLDIFIAKSVGIPPAALPEFHIEYKKEWFSPYIRDFDKEHHICIALRGSDLGVGPIMEFIDRYRHKLFIEVGRKGEMLLPERKNLLKCDTSFEEMGWLIHTSDLFIGIMSAPLVLANGNPRLKKLIVWDGQSWDMRHPFYSEMHKYVVNTNLTQEILDEML